MTPAAGDKQLSIYFPICGINAIAAVKKKIEHMHGFVILNEHLHSSQYCT